MDGSRHIGDPGLVYGFAREQGVLPLRREGDGVIIGQRQGASARALLEARRVLGCPLQVEDLSDAEFDRQLSQIYAGQGFDADALDERGEDGDDLAALAEGMPQSADLLDAADDAPIIRLINGLIAEAVRRKASDIHIEPYEQSVSVRLRIDGVLQEVLALPARPAPRLVSRIKVMARLDITEKRLPQDGRMSITLGGHNLDVRVSTLPSRHGERVVMRLLDKEQGHIDLDALGMPAGVYAAFEASLSAPNGIVLVTGPTGSGKTTTLYAALSRLNDRSRNILTIEDPVEYALDGVGQTQVNTRVGMTFAAGLRAILRQDPDVVMVGEIRDVETARIAVQASLTGHLVFSTVHTNSAAAAITRLRDMGVEPFLLASSIRAVVAQRLLRRLCDACKRPAPVPDSIRARLAVAGEVPAELPAAVGCQRCNGTGFEGRLGIYEIVAMDDALRRLVHDDADEDRIAEAAFRKAGRLIDSGYAQVLTGRTTLEEVLRVCRADGDSDGGL